MPKSKTAAKGKSGKMAVKGKKMSKSKAIKKTAPAEGGIKKRRNKAGTLALREIKKYQKTLDHVLPKAPFQRLVRNIV